MATVQNMLNRFKAFDLPKVVQTTLYESEKDIVFFNATQMQEGKGNDGKNLKHSNKKVKGVYTKFTEEIASHENPILPKKAGELYNFGYTGSFLANLKINVDSTKLKIFSTGTGVSEKSLFFKGYLNMFGLNQESKDELIREKGLRSKLLRNVKSTLKL